AVDQVLREAQRANVTIYSVLPRTTLPETEFRSEYLHEVSDKSGGFVVASGDLDAGITQIFRESGSYYILGYVPTNPTRLGEFRHVAVTMRRPDLTVRAREGYQADPIESISKKGKPPPSPLLKAVSGILPDPELPLQVHVAPFLVPNVRVPGETALAVTVAATQPAVDVPRRKQVGFL